MPFERENATVSLVATGVFNPAIITPAWLEARGFISSADAEAAQVGIVNPDLTMFGLPWANIEVQPQRFVIGTTTEPFVLIHDLMASIFQRLADTPIFQFGINRGVHIRAGTQEVMNRVGDRLAPKELWEELVPSKEPNRQGGLQSLVMRNMPRKDDAKGSINYKIEPSAVVRFGIYVDVNDHFELGTISEPARGPDLVRVLTEHWELSERRHSSLQVLIERAAED